MPTKSQQIADRVNNIRAVSDFNSVQLAVDWANTNNQALYWDEVYTVTGNVQNFHEVKHFGPGGVTRGGNTWYVEGKESTARTLYVLNTGSDTNDGLDSSYPLASEQYGLNALQKIHNVDGETATIQMVTGHQYSTVISLQDVDLSWVTISSDDATVTANPALGNSDHLFLCWNGHAPVWNVLLDANGEGNYGFNFQRGAVGRIEAGKGMINTYGRTLYVNNGSYVEASDGVFTGSGSVATGGLSRGAWVARGSTLICERADFSDSVGIGIYVSRASTVHAMGLIAENCGAQAVWVHRSSRLTAHSVAGANVSLSSTSSSVAAVVRVARTSSVSLNADGGGTVTITQNAATEGVEVVSCSSVNVNSATITGNTTTSTEGISAGTGAVVDASSCSITGFIDGISVNGGSVYANLCSIQNNSRYGVLCTRGSEVHVASGTVSSNGVGQDITVTRGGKVVADGCTTTNGVGAPDIATDTNFSVKDAWDANGVIFA